MNVICRCYGGFMVHDVESYADPVSGHRVSHPHTYWAENHEEPTAATDEQAYSLLQRLAGVPRYYDLL